MVRFYFDTGASVRETAKRFKVTPKSVHLWISLYREKGEERLLGFYRKPWNRARKEIEERIILLKERNPSITVREARRNLKEKGISISVKGVWAIWKRYGYAGFIKKNMTNEFTEYCAWTRQATILYQQAEKLFRSGEVRKAARKLNAIPFLPKNEILMELPGKLIGLARKIEKLSSLYGKITLSQYLKMTRMVFNRCKKRRLYFSALRAGIMEVQALEWIARPKDQLKKIKRLEHLMKRKGDGRFSNLLFEPQFTLLIAKGIAHANLSQIRESYAAAKECSRLLKRRKYVSPYFMTDLGYLYFKLEDFKKAEELFSASMPGVDEGLIRQLKGEIAKILLSRGEYSKPMKTARSAKFYDWVHSSRKPLFLSTYSLLRGKHQKAIALALESLSFSRREELNKDIFNASLIVASSYCSMGEIDKARRLLKSIVPFLEKHKLVRQRALLNILLSKGRRREGKKMKHLFPTQELALLLKNGEYWKALSYAKKRDILDYFYRFVLFFPEQATKLIEQGKPAELPRAIQKFPVFNKEIPVYTISILDKIDIFKNRKRLRVKLQPKESAFLIHLALKAGEPGMSITLDSIYQNFWRKSKAPGRNLSHMLVGIKRALALPTHLLEITHEGYAPVLVNRGIHFITDYGEYAESLAKAKAFKRAGEWEFAKKEFYNAFSCFKAEPFKKMYDDWSDDRRLEILFSYEKELILFARELIARKRYREAEEFLSNGKSIIGYSEDIDFMLKGIKD
jgi:transposase